MSWIIIISIIFGVIIIGVISYVIYIKTKSTVKDLKSSEESKTLNTEEESLKVKCPENDMSNYEIEEIPTLGSKILQMFIKTISQIIKIVLPKSFIEYFALDTNTYTSSSQLKSGNYYQLGSIKQGVSSQITNPLNSGSSCPPYPSNIYVLAPTSNAICKTGDTNLYNIPNDSSTSCILNSTDGFYYKTATLYPESTISVYPAINGGTTCSSQYPSTKSFRCTPINATCKTLDTDLYNIPADSLSTCNILQSDGFYYKTATLKDDSSITINNSLYGGSTCSSRYPSTKLIKCGPINATCDILESDLYGPDDSNSVCNISRTDGWYKNGILNPETSIQLTPSINGGLTCTQQYSSTKTVKCGPIDAVCTTDITKLYPNPPPDSTTVCKIATRRTDISPNPVRTTTSSTTYNKRQKEVLLNTSDSAITITPQKNNGLTCTQQNKNIGYADCSSSYYFTVVNNNFA